MTTLSIHPDNAPDQVEVLDDHAAIAARLAELGVEFTRWPVRADAAALDTAGVLQAFSDDIAELSQRFGFQHVDVARITPDNPQRAEFRKKFLNEHTHDDFEIRFFVAGRGLFYLHIDGHVYCVLCTAGDLISVPPDTTHWFDMGEHPEFTCIRFFTTPEGWVGKFTGSTIAERFPSFDAFVTAHAA
ncbi:MAG: AraC family ligand binding domain-containing protein [Chromatiales bacterium]|nr:AraC family ligand binding domain-containing protein [Chromatiales bacterium]